MQLGPIFPQLNDSAASTFQLLSLKGGSQQAASSLILSAFLPRPQETVARLLKKVCGVCLG